MSRAQFRTSLPPQKSLLRGARTSDLAAKATYLQSSRSTMHHETINITLPDGSIQHFPRGITGLEIAQHISEGLARQVLAVLVNGEVWDATRAISEDATARLLTWNDEAGKSVFWHSSAHLLAEALEALYPDIQLGIGPAIERGFYYDIDFGEQDFDATHLDQVEAKMLALAQQKKTLSAN